MKSKRDWGINVGKWTLVGCLLLLIPLGAAFGADLPEIKKRGLLRAIWAFHMPSLSSATGSGWTRS